MLLPLAELQQSTELIELAAFANMPS